MGHHAAAYLGYWTWTVPSINRVFVIGCCLMVMMIMMSLDGLDIKYEIRYYVITLDTQRQPIRGQYSGHVTSVDQSGASILWSDQSEAQESSLDGMWLRACSTLQHSQACRMTFTARAATFPLDKAYHRIPRPVTTPRKQE